MYGSYICRVKTHWDIENASEHTRLNIECLCSKNLKNNKYLKFVYIEDHASVNSKLEDNYWHFICLNYSYKEHTRRSLSVVEKLFPGRRDSTCGFTDLKFVLTKTLFYEDQTHGRWFKKMAVSPWMSKGVQYPPIGQHRWTPLSFRKTRRLRPSKDNAMFLCSR